MNIVIPIITFSKSGGMRVLERLADEWLANGHSVDIVVADNSTPYYPTCAHVINLNSARNAIKKEIALLTKYLINNFRKYNVIIANGHVSAYPVLFASIRYRTFTKAYYYIQAYETDFYNEMRFGIKKFLRKFGTSLTYRFPFTRIVNANLYCNYKGIKTEKVIYPGLDLKNYYAKDYNHFNKLLTVGCIGRPVVWKGTYDVCEAIKLLKAENFKVDFHIAFFDVDIVEHIYEKPDGDEKLADFYRRMDILVAPGHIQLGSVHYPVIEAMACGTSVITTGYYPANKLNSYIVPVKAPNAIANCIKYISEHHDDAINKRAQALHDIKNFSWDIVAKKFLSMIIE